MLIIGGGDCGIAEEVLKHKALKSVTQVEIDASVVEFSKEHFPEFTKPVFRDKRFESVIDDGMKYVADDRPALRRDHRGLDRSAGAGRGAVHQGILCRLQALHGAGRRDGDAERRAVLAARTSSLIGRHVQEPVRRRRLLRRRDPDLCGRPHGDGLGHQGQGAAPAPGRTIAARYKKAGSFKTKYWTPEVHVAAFALPRFIAEHVRGSEGR